MATQQRNLENLQIGTMLSSAIKTIAATGAETGINFAGFDGDIVFDLNFSAAGAGGTLDLRIEESDTLGGTYTAVTGGTFTQIGNAAGSQRLVISKDDAKNFLRVNVTARGGSASVNMSLDYIGLRKYQ